MSRFAQHHPTLDIRREGRNNAIEVAGECCLREQQIQLANDLHRTSNVCRMRSQLVGDFAQDSEDLALFFFMEADKFVVKVYGLQRFDEQRLSAAARPMD